MCVEGFKFICVCAASTHKTVFVRGENTDFGFSLHAVHVCVCVCFGVFSVSGGLRLPPSAAGAGV